VTGRQSRSRLQDQAYDHGIQEPAFGLAAMTLHSLLGRHVADTKASHWEKGSFVTRCTICDAAMIKLPGLAWRLRPAAG
jgi:hypothetical protein